MKKVLRFFIIAVICFNLISCSERTDAYAIEKGIYGDVKIKEINYKNHSYLEFKDWSSYGIYIVILHNPDCNCLRKYK